MLPADQEAAPTTQQQQKPQQPPTVKPVSTYGGGDAAPQNTDVQLGNMNAGQGAQLQSQAPIDPLAFTSNAGNAPQANVPAPTGQQYETGVATSNDPATPPVPDAPPQPPTTPTVAPATAYGAPATRPTGMTASDGGYFPPAPTTQAPTFDPGPAPTPSMTTAQWDAYSPLAGLTEQQKAAALEANAAKANPGYTPNFSNYAVANTPTGTVGANGVAQYNVDPTKVAQLTALTQNDPAVTGAQAAQDAARKSYSDSNVAQNDYQNAVAADQLANAKNHQVGYAGSGMDYADPNGAPIANPATNQRPPGEVDVASGLAPKDRPGGSDASLPGPSTTQTYQPPPITYGGGGGSSGGSSGTGGGPNTPATDASAGLTPQQTKVDPSNDLRSQQITPGDFLDRFKLAQQEFGTYANSTNPEYELALKRAGESAAANGRLGSGMLRTSYGDLANQRGQQLTNERDSIFQKALEGSVGDAQTKFQDLMAEQAYQTGSQNQAFSQNVTGQRLQDDLTNSSFSRAMQMLTAGNAGNPAQAYEYMAQTYGQQAGQAMQALQQYMTAHAGNADTSSAEYQKLLKDLIDKMQHPTTAGGG